MNNRKALAAWMVLLMPILCSFSFFSEEQLTTSVRINTLETTNNGTPFYIYFKEMEKGEFFRSEYQQIFHEAFMENPDIHPELILPGKSYNLKIPRTQKEKLLGVYVLYTNPGEDWKFPINGSSDVALSLGDSNIMSVSLR